MSLQASYTVPLSGMLAKTGVWGQRQRAHPEGAEGSSASVLHTSSPTGRNTGAWMVPGMSGFLLHLKNTQHEECTTLRADSLGYARV